MITWITVWVLTVPYKDNMTARAYSYQLTYATQDLCLKQIGNHSAGLNKSRCDFQQIPVVINK